MTRRFDSLQQALRAYELCRIWKPCLYTGAMRDRLDRTHAAAEYLYRRVIRSEAR